MAGYRMSHVRIETINLSSDRLQAGSDSLVQVLNTQVETVTAVDEASPDWIAFDPDGSSAVVATQRGVFLRFGW